MSPATGDITVDPVADVGTFSDGWCPAGTGGGGSAPTFSMPLTASTNALPVGGGSVTLSWTVSGATGCTASSSGVSGWNGNAVTSPTVVSLTASGNYSFGVSCSNNDGSTSGGTVTVNVATQTTTECTNRPAPVGLTQQGSMVNYNLGGTLNQQNSEFPLNSSINLSGYVPLMGTSFNQPGQVARLFLDTGKYAAMSFTTSGANAPVGATGGVSWAAASTAVFSAQLSPCPGDFDWVTDANCKASGVETGGITWKIGTKPASNPGWYCYLDPNKTYYLSVVAADHQTWTTTTCASSYCTWLVSIGAL
ncbi:MAG: hypothetical protein IPF83_09010 [Rhodanobacteraceae bacterium]|nr:hypothetical protein [Rhodanobacteraceae bacterium]MBK7044583.1 hypothetical protein [Rhodanobacteraceae bacterium]MBP9153997.1 hypothetical protein [Xanthomonadales bacterium]